MTQEHEFKKTDKVLVEGEIVCIEPLTVKFGNCLAARSNITIDKYTNIIPAPEFIPGQKVEVSKVPEFTKKPILRIYLCPAPQGGHYCLSRGHEDNYRDNNAFMVLHWNYCRSAEEDTREKLLEDAVSMIGCMLSNPNLPLIMEEKNILHRYNKLKESEKRSKDE